MWGARPSTDEWQAVSEHEEGDQRGCGWAGARGSRAQVHFFLTKGRPQERLLADERSSEGERVQVRGESLCCLWSLGSPWRLEKEPCRKEKVPPKHFTNR